MENHRNSVNTLDRHSSLSPKRREKLPEPDIPDTPTYNNNLTMESAQYQIVGQTPDVQCYRSVSSEQISQMTRQHEKKSSSSSKTCKFGCALTFALSIATAIGATAFLTYLFLKVHYEDCLTVDDLDKLRKTQMLRPPRDCREHYEFGALVDGIYRVYPEKTTPTQVYCDMTNGGWTIIQRRKNGRESFDRTWNEYVEGFGNLTGDFWMGLKYQNFFTEHENQYEIAFNLMLTNKNGGPSLATAVYESFHVGDEETNYTMRVSSRAEYNPEMEKHVDDRKFFYFHNNMKFTTKDVDLDTRSKGSCVDLTECGGFWYKNCHMLCLNGRFDRMYFFETANMHKYFSSSIVKIRPFS